MLMHNATRKTPLTKAPKVSARCHPYVYVLELDFELETLTAQRPTQREMTSLSIWKASATRARECTAYPTESSRKKNMVSMARRMVILVDLEYVIATQVGTVSGVIAEAVVV
jgi:hypothetical protein